MPPVGQAVAAGGKTTRCLGVEVREGIRCSFPRLNVSISVFLFSGCVLQREEALQKAEEKVSLVDQLKHLLEGKLSEMGESDLTFGILRV